MPEIPASLAEFATRELRRRGIEIRTGTMLDVDGRPTRPRSPPASASRRALLCWTAGVKPSPAVRRLGLPLGPDRRIEVDATMRVAGRENVWAIGDAAAVPDPAKHRQGAQPAHLPARPAPGPAVADNVAATLAGGPPTPFRYRTLGRVRGHGPAQGGGHDARRAPARLPRLVRGAHLPPGDDAGLARRVRLVVDWTVGLFFGRAAAELGQLGHPPALEPAEGAGT